MKCDLCQKNDAMMHLSETIEGESRELHLCEGCAREKGAFSGSEFGLSGLLAGLADFGAAKPGVAGVRENLECGQCGMTYEDFRKAGRLGCGACYETFRRYLAPLLKRIHAATHHVGKVPAPKSARAKSKSAGDTVSEAKEGLRKLRERLKQAIASEQFEQAAHLRDQIHTLEAKRKKVKRP